MNAGKEGGQLSACYVLPIPDSLEGIFDSLKFAAKIHQSGGGTGFSFSEIRPRGSQVRSTHGTASGPVSFIHIFDVATETIKQGGVRRGANMAILNVEHPDIEEFIDSKRDMRALSNFNISVGASDRFMQAVQAEGDDGDFWLKDPKTGADVKKVRAKDLFERMVQSAWSCGDPGLVFLDRINLFNPTPLAGRMLSTNPCGEQPLLPYESCNLGSLNLGLYFKKKSFDWEGFRKDIFFSTRFLDNVIEVNSYPLAECRRITLRNRKIGLGVMGFADLLLHLEIAYTDPQAEKLGEQIMSFLDREAKRASQELAASRGAFPNWKGSLWQKLGYSPLRNATVSTVAPTGTISMIAGASSGIEPIFSAAYFRNVLNGKKLLEIHPAVRQRFAHLSLESFTPDEINREMGAAWVPSHRVPVDVHVRIQAAFQRHSDSAVSKTINLPRTATTQDVAQAYLLAYRRGCKGITVYRDQSRGSQVLETAGSSDLLPESNEGVCLTC